MSIRYKLFIAFSIVILLAAAVAGYAIHVLGQTSALVVRLYDGPLMAVSQARTAQLHFTEARNVLERALLLRDATSAKTIEKIDGAMKQFETDLNIVRERIGNDGANELIKQALASSQDWLKAGMAYVKPPASGVTELPLTSVIIAKGDKVASAIDLVVEAASAYGFNFRSEAEATAGKSKTNLIALAIAAAIVGFALAGGIAYSFTRPIRRAMTISEEIANGNFAVEIVNKRRDELGRLLGSLDKTQTALREMTEAKERDRAEQLAVLRAQVEDERLKTVETQNKVAEEQASVVASLAAGQRKLSDGDLSFRLGEDISESYKQIRDDFNTALQQLQDTIAAIADSTREVSNAAAEISGSTTDLSQRTEEQAANLEETSASMEEISATVRKNAENAQQANQFANGTRDVADRGGEVVSRAVGAMSRIEESSRKISDIIGVIDEIAFQTNLLALNAAVEAARAGEAGRGFAVVASEVRRLAQRSSQAAKDIKELINRSSNQVQEGVQLVNQAGTSLTEIVDSIKRVTNIVSDIASASGEQATGIDQVNRALSQMDEMTQQNSALVEENAAAAKTLEQLSLAMEERVSFFNLDGAVASSVVRPVVEESEPVAQEPIRRAPQPVRKPAEVKSETAPRRPPARRGGPVGRMQTALATALKAEPEWEEF